MLRCGVAASLAMAPLATSLAQPVYQLRAGDELRVIVLREPDLSGVFTIDGEGNLDLPLIGKVAVAGLSTEAADTLITQAYLGDYLITPNVALEVINQRPVYILGAVESPGIYAYVDGLTVSGLIRLAGSTTDKARPDGVRIKRFGDGDDAPATSVGLDAIVLPGDVVTVSERGG